MINTIHDENLRKLAEDEDFTVEEMMSGEDENREGENAPLPGRLKKIFPAAIVVLACLIGVLCISLRPKKTGPSDDGRSREEYEEMVSVTEAEKDTQGEEIWEPKPETEKETAKETQAEDKKLPADLSWQDEIFGTARETVIKRPITVSGLTENEKNLTGFRESDFVRSLSAFLAANNVSTSAVTFTGTVACSAGNAAAYLADLKGVSDRRLSVLFFPKFPGKYLFTLETAVKEKTAESGTENRSQTPVSAPVQTQTQAPTAVQTPQAETQSAYDAMRLKVKGVPGELSNYLSNPYELQYSLYDYLYKKGIRNAESASVTDYYIDSDERVATIQIKIDGVGSVTAIYDRDGNSYSYQ